MAVTVRVLVGPERTGTPYDSFFGNWNGILVPLGHSEKMRSAASLCPDSLRECISSPNFPAAMGEPTSKGMGGRKKEGK